MSGKPAWTPAGDGVTISVRVTPRGGRDALEGLIALADGRQALKVRVRAVPEDGKANAAVIRLLADRLDVPVAQVELAAGGSARLKSFRVSGDVPTLLRRLAELL
ncbi:DUF167 family protein [Ancylobacter oerskovii]|uniref:UPF0235 protein ACFSNC_07365 n=1 Tax=Ancylobacter oerskovii TaxID=459519 RepID=A0ABW4YVN8_9HYPH|nr:DUF167 family protein [Ancylobacter oerskovii]MBS7544334.1 DUF167 domain-containing protein [Ancylobacter oerskovii]